MTTVTPQHPDHKTAGGPVGPGDQTLVGTQLQVITQRNAGDIPTFKFQITSAIGLKGNGRTLLELLEAKQKQEAIALLEEAGSNDSRFVKMMKAAFDGVPAPFSDDSRGRDGFPNFRTIFDAASSPTETFQVHTILDIDTPDSARAIAAELVTPGSTKIPELVRRHCKICDHPHVEAFLQHALEP